MILTVFTPLDDYPQEKPALVYGEEVYDERDHLRMWADFHFDSLQVPDATGGFRETRYTKGLRACKECAAAVFVQDELDLDALNKHRLDHDQTNELRMQVRKLMEA